MELRGRRLDDLAARAIYAGQKDALLDCIERRSVIRDLTLSLLNSSGAVRHYLLNATPKLDAQDRFERYVGTLRAWDEVPFSEHRKSEATELLRQADVALEKEAMQRRDAGLLLAALQILIEPSGLQEKCAKLFEIFGPPLAFDQAVVLRRGLRAKMTVAASSDASLLGIEWPGAAMPEAVLAGEARLIDGEGLAGPTEDLPVALRTAKTALFVPLRIDSETAVLVALGQDRNHFKVRHLALMKRVSLIATKAFQDEDQKAALVTSSKLAAMGELLATIAHEINQPLTIISMSASNGRMLLEDGGELRDLDPKLERIEQQARRAADIIQAVRKLSYADRMSSGDQSIDLRDALQSVEVISRIGLEKNGITLTVHVDDACPMAQGQSSWLQQVVLNLITNARDAILDRLAEDPERAPGAIRVSVSEVEDHVVLRIADNGGGIPEDIQEKIFAPFFTLKEMGKGNGLGLALCRRLISDMGGQITLRNEDEGAVFEIWLRSVSGDAGAADRPAPPASATG